jgi:V8-like Glu-specific endopeptidase
MASIGTINAENVWKHQCGATLISDRHFLTAAHCAKDECVFNHKQKLEISST